MHRVVCPASASGLGCGDSHLGQQRVWAVQKVVLLLQKVVGSCPVPVSALQRSKRDLLCLLLVIISGLLSA